MTLSAWNQEFVDFPRGDHFFVTISTSLRGRQLPPREAIFSPLPGRGVRGSHFFLVRFGVIKLYKYGYQAKAHTMSSKKGSKGFD